MDKSVRFGICKLSPDARFYHFIQAPFLCQLTLNLTFLNALLQVPPVGNPSISILTEDIHFSGIFIINLEILHLTGRQWNAKQELRARALETYWAKELTY